MNAVINCAAYSQGRRVGNIQLHEISEVLKQTDKFVWVGLHEPGEGILKVVQEEFSLHDLAIEDALRAHQRPKLEVYGDSIFIVLRTAQMNFQQHKIDFGETHFFLGDLRISSCTCFYIRIGSFSIFSFQKVWLVITPANHQNFFRAIKLS